MEKSNFNFVVKCNLDLFLQSFVALIAAAKDKLVNCTSSVLKVLIHPDQSVQSQYICIRIKLYTKSLAHMLFFTVCLTTFPTKTFICNRVGGREVQRGQCHPLLPKKKHNFSPQKVFRCVQKMTNYREKFINQLFQLYIAQYGYRKRRFPAIRGNEIVPPPP